MDSVFHDCNDIFRCNSLWLIVKLANALSPWKTE